MNNINFELVTMALCNSLINTNIRYDFVNSLTAEWFKFAKSATDESRIHIFTQHFEKL